MNALFEGAESVLSWWHVFVFPLHSKDGRKVFPRSYLHIIFLQSFVQFSNIADVSCVFSCFQLLVLCPGEFPKMEKPLPQTVFSLLLLFCMIPLYLSQKTISKAHWATHKWKPMSPTRQRSPSSSAEMKKWSMRRRGDLRKKMKNMKNALDWMLLIICSSFC